MKKLTFYFFVLMVFTVASCTDKGTLSEPIEPLSKEDSIKITLLRPSPTKEPYITLKDVGIEAELIAQGLDSDNQINGRISVEDADKIEFFGRQVYMIVANPEDPDFYSPAFYNRYFTVMPILKKEYKEKTGKELTVKELSDVNFFKNLRKLYVTFDTETIDSLSLSANEKLEDFGTFDNRIKIIDFDGCKQMKKINFIRSPHPLYDLLDKIYISQCSKLEYLSYVGRNIKNLDVSKNINLKYLEIQATSASLQIEVEELNLCNNSYLEYLRIPLNYYGRVSLEKNVYAFYETSKLQNTPNGFPFLNYGGEVVICD